MLSALRKGQPFVAFDRSGLGPVWCPMRRIDTGSLLGLKDAAVYTICSYFGWVFICFGRLLLHQPVELGHYQFGAIARRPFPESRP